jgi:hypothetical protein
MRALVILGSVACLAGCTAAHRRASLAEDKAIETLRCMAVDIDRKDPVYLAEGCGMRTRCTLDAAGTSASCEAPRPGREKLAKNKAIETLQCAAVDFDDDGAAFVAQGCGKGTRCTVDSAATSAICEAPHAVKSKPTEVSVGVLKADVEELWGDPCERLSSSTADGEVETWTYCRVCRKSDAMFHAIVGGRPSSWACTGRKEVEFKSGIASRVDVVRD